MYNFFLKYCMVIFNKLFLPHVHLYRQVSVHLQKIPFSKKHKPPKKKKKKIPPPPPQKKKKKKKNVIHVFCVQLNLVHVSKEKSPVM